MILNDLPTELYKMRPTRQSRTWQYSMTAIHAREQMPSLKILNKTLKFDKTQWPTFYVGSKL